MSHDSDVRILLVGRTGHGKSSTGNTILGKDYFEVSGASKSKTKTCKWSKSVDRLGKVVEVVDTPGLFDTDLDQVAVHKELLRALTLTSPGFHVIAFVLMRGRFTEEIQKTKDLFFDWFGKDVDKFACIILTDTDSEEDKQTFISDDPHPKLAELVNICDNNVIGLNNRGSDESKDLQVGTLFGIIDDIKKKNDDKHFSNVFFKVVESYLHNRNSSYLSNESIRIIETAAANNQLSQSQIDFLQQMYTGLLSMDDNNEESVTKSSVDSIESDQSDLAQDMLESDIGKTGNLQIYDSVSNERLPNRLVYNPTARQQEEMLVGSDDVMLNSYDDGASCNMARRFFEVPGEISVQSPMNAEQHSIYQIDYGETSGVMHGSAAQTTDNQDLQPEQKRSGRRSRRQGRVVDLESVRYDIPAPSRDDFKGKINDEENGDEELHALSGYFKNAWRYCKRKFAKCILL